MKASILLLFAVVSFNAQAKISRVDFDRDTASSRNTNLSSAFQNAIRSSDGDLSSTKTTVLVEEEARIASWSNRKREKITVQGTAAVDPGNIKASPKKISGKSQSETRNRIKAN